MTTDSSIVTGLGLFTLSASAYPGLLDGWCGPVEWAPSGSTVWRRGVYGPIDKSEGVLGVSASGCEVNIRLDLRRPECAHRVRDFLLRELHCLDWTRRLSADQAAVIIAASALRVAAGEEPIHVLLSPWERSPWERGPVSRRPSRCRRLNTACCDDEDDLPAVLFAIKGSAKLSSFDRYGGFCSGVIEKSVTAAEGDEERSADFLLALPSGFALDNGDHLLVPLAGGKVGRVEAA